MEPVGATTGPKFVNEEYEEKVNEYYKNHLPIISRQKFNSTIIDTLRSANSESELADFLGFGAIELIECVIENRESIIASDSDGRLTTKSEEQQIWKAVTKVDKKSNMMSAERGRKKIKKMMILEL